MLPFALHDELCIHLFGFGGDEIVIRTCTMHKYVDLVRVAFIVPRWCHSMFTIVYGQPCKYAC